MGVVDDRVTLGISQIMEEVFLNETNYILTDKEDPPFLVPKLCILENRMTFWSIVGMLNGRKTQTEVRLNIKIKEVKTEKCVETRNWFNTDKHTHRFTDKRRNGVWKIRVRCFENVIEDGILKH